MDENQLLTKTYPVVNFYRVLLQTQHENYLTILPGAQEGLTIQAPTQVLSRIKARVRNRTLEISLGGDWKERLRDALSTSLSRSHISYVLRVNRLTSLEVFALAHIRAERLKARQLSIRFNGAGTLALEDLTAERLAIMLSGANRAQCSGEVIEQSIILRGMSQYDASQLRSKRTNIELTGAGAITVWTLDRLEVDIRGPGSVGYYGAPDVYEKLSPLSSLTHLEGAQALA